MKTIGLIGGIASGKSLAAEMLGELGARVLDADRAGHAVLAEDSAVQEAIERRWGHEVRDSGGGIDRAAVAGRVFAPGPAGQEDRTFLESWTHPRIRAALESERESLAAKGAKIVVIDAALLFEAGWHDVCNLIVFVDAPRATRLEWARQRGWSDEQFAAREAAQWPVEEKRRRADVVIPNIGTKEGLRRAVRAFWEEYVDH